VKSAIENFEAAFSAINLSKVNLGKVRRELVSYFIENYKDLANLGEFDLLDKIADVV
jgi:hypothetical protein